jgi:hypothetical protein
LSSVPPGNLAKTTSFYITSPITLVFYATLSLILTKSFLFNITNRVKLKPETPNFRESVPSF